MALFIHRITKDRGQYRVTLPKELIENLGLEKTRVVEIWEGEDDTINIKEYHGKRKKKRDIPEDQS